MYRQTDRIINAHAQMILARVVCKFVILNILAELSYKSHKLGPSLMRADLTLAELVLGRVVGNSF